MALHEMATLLSGHSAVALTTSKGLGTQSQGLDVRGSFLRAFPISDVDSVDWPRKSRLARPDQAGVSRIEASFGPSTSGRHSPRVAEPELFIRRSSALSHSRPFIVSEGKGMLEGGANLVLVTRRGSRSKNAPKRRQNRSSHRVLAAVMSLDAGGVNWQAVEPGHQNEDGEGDVSEPLSCLFIGPIEEADQAHLEALYMQARDSYYSGRPLILDEMFDKVETRLRNLRSKMVLKYPRCSLKKFAAYSDAEEDTSQMSMLMAVWGALGLAGAVAAVVPPLCAATSVCDRLVNEAFEPWWAAQSSPLANFLLALGLLGGVPLASAAVQQVKSMLRGEVVALKGCCPNCGEEVYAFLDAKETKPRHKSECHVCEHPLVFHATVETSKKDGKQWAYGRVYLVTRSKDLEPQKQDRIRR